MKRMTVFYKDFYLSATDAKQINFIFEQALENFKDVDIIAVTDDDDIEHYLTPHYSVAPYTE